MLLLAAHRDVGGESSAGGSSDKAKDCDVQQDEAAHEQSAEVDEQLSPLAPEAGRKAEACDGQGDGAEDDDGEVGVDEEDRRVALMEGCFEGA